MKAAVTALSSTVCPGGTARVRIEFTNNTGAAVDVEEPSLQLLAAGPRWSLGQIAPVHVEPHDTTVVETSVSLPRVSPGRYTLRVYGYPPGGTISVSEPTGADD